MTAALPPLTWSAALTEWTPDPPTIALVVVLGAGYLVAVRRHARAADTPCPRSRQVAFGAGLGLLLLMGVSFFGVYANTLFWVRAAQVITLLMVVPLCLALGAPVTLALPWVRPLLASRFLRVLTFPATASLLLVVTPWLLYFTGWYPAVLGNTVVDHLTRLALLLVGFLYFYSRLQLDPVPHKYPHLISVVITFVEVIFDAALGLVLWLSPHLVAATYYQAVGRTWGPSLHTDQILGAGVLWLVGDLAGLPFLGALLNRMSHDDATEAAAIDRRLDEAEATTPAETPTRLWWEDDPVLAERFRRGRR